MESLDFFIILQAKHNKRVIRQDSRAISCLYITCFFLFYLYSNELWSAETVAVTLSCLWCACVAIIRQKKLKLQSKSYVFLHYCPAFHPDLCQAKGTVCVTPLKTLFPCAFLFFIQLCGECALFTVPIQPWLE